MDDFVAHHLRGVSRTYALLVPQLPTGLDQTVGVAYLLMRVLDTIEDAPGLDVAQRRDTLDRFDAALAGDAVAIASLTGPWGETESERTLMEALPAVLAHVSALHEVDAEAIRRCARRMSGGVRGLLARSADRGTDYPAVQSVNELREYCYYVAGVVGEMLCGLMARHLAYPGLAGWRQQAVELGLGLQMVNILKDATTDALQRRRYLPPAATPEAHREVCGAVRGEARRCLTRGVEYVLALPAGAPELRTFSGLPIVWGALTLAQSERDGDHAKIDRAAIHTTSARFAQVVQDEQALRAWMTELIWGPDHGPRPCPRV